MKKIGLVGEDLYDTRSIAHLLKRKYPSYQFKPLCKGLKGSQLDTPKLSRMLQVELKSSTFSKIIFIRDLDGLPSENKKIKGRRDWFDKLNIICQKKGVLLLCIYEIEGLILADMDTFNKIYGSKIRFTGNPEQKKKPKEFLASNTRKEKIYGV